MDRIGTIGAVWLSHEDQKVIFGLMREALTKLLKEGKLHFDEYD